MQQPASSWWSPDRHADRRPALMLRARIKRGIAAHLEAQGFTEVECGALQVSPGNEAHLHAFATKFAPEGATLDAGAQFYLHTSPEFACKKLLAAGETRIFEFARVFRNGERGPLHAPEFTMLEWYRVGALLEQAMADCADFARVAQREAGGSPLSWRGRSCDAEAQPEIVSVVEAVARNAGFDLEPVLEDRDALAAAARAIGVRVADDDGWSDIFSRILVERVEPHLGDSRLTFLTDYPASEAALARRGPDSRFARRFELYACGVELANGFDELTDAKEQRIRLEAEMNEKARRHGERYPLDEDFLAALAVMPPACGVAMGFDRLVMLAAGAPHIDAVIWTPFGAME